ncbi:MAG: TM0106 family RecB-like putative nuclease [Herbiconiux sp.]|uniref:TM0106 family RecB-like putative nuclease n=1 Tax=Herbiconiux sp. TaxID=1871186 RepID=UPI00120071F0|nr:TM0106 family RecB-like putative nuclease [Herbiconiux sp.]TAJ49809.1 MAG: TM0106 family RecB-like putative nuclease [Herbiconiux sp.]
MIVIDAAPGTAPLVLYSATDLTAAATCEFGLVRKLDAKLGRCDPVDDLPDAMLERTARLGDDHELRTLESYRERFGAYSGGAAGVAEMERPERPTPELLARQQSATVEALRAGADVVFQGVFFDGRFLGYADFLVKAGSTADRQPVYEVYDTKLARRAKVTALLQVAAYADQLQRLGVPVGESVHLLLGDGSTSTHLLADILPVYRDRRMRLEELLDERVDAPLAQWGDPRYAACGRCAVCAPEVAASGDLFQVGGMRANQRLTLRDAGITTIEQLAVWGVVSTGDVPGIGPATLETLRDQARMQLAGRDGRLTYRVHDAAVLAGLPQPDPGDLFFDFEGDPLYTENAGPDWGLDYLFGVVEHAESGDGTVFRPFWAHSYAEEKQALIDFLAYVTERRRRYPGLHIYHYADYERAHLRSLAARHGVGEGELDDLLRDEVLVDLYPMVKRSIRVSSPSYSLKKLEPLYMGDQLRSSEVTNGADSITAYVEYTELRDRGRTDASAAAAAVALLGEIADYNEYDCISTLRLRNWLLERGRENGVVPAPPQRLDEEVSRDFEESALHRALVEWAERLEGQNGGDLAESGRQAVALAAAAIDYHRRENKSFWWEHYDRLMQPVEEWADTRDVLVVTHAVVERDWHREEGQRVDRRLTRLTGALAPGSKLEEGAAGRFFVYDEPAAGSPVLPPSTRASASQRAAHPRTKLVEVRELPNGSTHYVFEEVVAKGGDHYSQLPIAVTPSAPPPTRAQQSAIAEWGQTLLDSLPALLPDAAVDLLRRIPPRRRDGGVLEPFGRTLSASAAVSGARDSSARDAPVAGERTAAPRPSAEVIRDALLALDDSYLAVQGPPGTGKTFTGARVVSDLVREHGWAVGVVAQSHAVVEHMLGAIVRAGVDPAHVGKNTGESDAPFTVLGKDGLAPFLRSARAAGHGVVIGGTAWDLSNPTRIGRRELDLLVIDEAGQFSLANTIAVSVAARNLLLLGDPQQLPQVTQGTHPEPVDHSALGWLVAGHDVIPPELGYFLDVSWRMHPDVCAPVSALSYHGELRSKLPETTLRSLDGVAPGLHLHPVAHHGNSTSSTEEADRVVQIVADLLGRGWTDAARAAPGVAAERALGAADLIVVAPYNAQVELLRAALDGAGFAGISVGTVDKFQGREAPVAIVSLAASAALDVPRGIEFLLMKNRLNVALSRAEWAAYLVFSPALTEHLPANAAELAMLSGFLRLTREVPTAPEPSG